ncbi:Replication protein A 70 kDa DNA-binding subunit B [Linum perenne]
MKIHKLDELSTQLIQPTVQVRVSHLWEAVYDGKTLHLDMILIDDKNNDIWAQMPRTLEKMFKSKIQEQKVYIMEKFKVMPATGGYRPVQNKLIIQFTSSTVVQEIPEMRSIPKYKFSFPTEAYVNSHIDQSKQLTDVLGAVIHKEETRMLRWGTKSTPMKNIKLQFTDGYVICVSLWGPLATEMDKISDVAGKRITILIVSSVYVKLFNGTFNICLSSLCYVFIQPLFIYIVSTINQQIISFEGMVYLSTTGASKLYPDLDVPEVQPLMAVYGTKKYPAISEKIETVTIEQLDLLKENSANKDKVFMVQCIVSRVDNIWYYNGCANDRCLKKIEDVMDNYVCVFCDHKMIKTVARYRVSMNVFDSTGTAELVLMDREGVIYYGINAEELLSSLNGIDTEEAPAVLKNTVGKHLTFLIKLTAYS